MTQLLPGICLTFDDLYVQDWCAARPIFDQYEARVTFCVTRLHTASKAQLEGLHQLQADGHEIGFHTRTHPKLDEYLAEYGLEHWLRHEIDDGISEHRAHGFPATSFASPFHASTPESRAETAKRFKIVRAAGPRKLPQEHLHLRIYNRLEADNVVNNIGIIDMQHKSSPNWKWHHTIMKQIAVHGGVGIFAGHGILPDRIGPGCYSTRRQLHRMLEAAKTHGLRFYTLSEFADVAAQNAQKETTLQNNETASLSETIVS